MDSEPMKRCRKCGKEWPKSGEYWPKNTKGYLCSPCKECTHGYQRKWRGDHREQRRKEKREYYERHLEQHREKFRKYRESHREQRREQGRKYAERNRDRLIVKSKKYRETPAAKEAAKEYRKNNREIQRERVKNYVNGLADGYIRDRLGRMGLENLTNELIQAKREQLMVFRKMKELKEELKNVSVDGNV